MSIPDRDKLRKHLDELGVDRVRELFESGAFARNKTPIIRQWLTEKATPSTLPSPIPKTPIEAVLDKAKRHPLIVLVATLGGVLIFFGNLSDAFHKLLEPVAMQEQQATSLGVKSEGGPAQNRMPKQCSGLISAQLTRKPEIAYDQWVVAISQMRAVRNVYNTQNLVETWGRIPVGLSAGQLILESTFTLKCLERTGQISLEASDAKGQYWGIQFSNVGIKFNK